MLVVTASQAIGAIWARTAYATVSELALNVAEADESVFPKEDKKAAAQLLESGTAWYVPFGVFLAAPFMAAYMLGRILWLIVTGREVTAKSLLGRREKQGPLSNALNAVIWKSNPLLIVWTAIWFLPVLPIAVIFGAGRLVSRVARRMPLAMMGTHTTA